jgi:hypothetical protein
MVTGSDKEQAELLMNDLLAFAEKMLSMHGEFHPFAGYMSDQGKITQMGVNMGNQFSASERARTAVLEESLRKLTHAQMPLVVGLVTNMLMQDEVYGTHDAIKIAIEHRSGYCADVFFWYGTVGEEHTVQVLGTTAQAANAHRFFPR